MARYFISSFNSSNFFSSCKELSARQCNQALQRAVLYQRATDLQRDGCLSFYNPIKAAVCIPVALLCPKAGAFQNPCAEAICYHGVIISQRAKSNHLIHIHEAVSYRFSRKSSTCRLSNIWP